MSVSAYAVFARPCRAGLATTGAHAFAIGSLLGLVALGQGPSTEANEIYHRVTMVVAVAGLILLPTPRARAALGRTDQETGRLGNEALDEVSKMLQSQTQRVGVKAGQRVKQAKTRQER